MSTAISHEPSSYLRSYHTALPQFVTTSDTPSAVSVPEYECAVRA